MKEHLWLDLHLPVCSGASFNLTRVRLWMEHICGEKQIINSSSKCLNGEMLLLKLLAGQNLLAGLSVAALPERYLSPI